jgi:hypothetical protein
MFEKRSVDEYNADLADLCRGSTCSKKTHSHGVKRECALNKIEGYHIAENFALDPMHIILEGIVPLEVGCVLYNLIMGQKSFFTE